MQARLRAQLGDRSKYSGERRRRSVVVASIVLTITDPLRGSYPFWYYLQAALIRSCGASFACMELTIISRFQRLQASTKPLLHSLFIVFQCFRIIAFLPCEIVFGVRCFFTDVGGLDAETVFGEVVEYAFCLLLQRNVLDDYEIASTECHGG